MQHKIDKKDVLIMTVMTVLYLVLALINLGTMKVPQIGYTPTENGEYFIVHFKEKHRINKINYYCGLGSERDLNLKMYIFNKLDDGTYDFLKQGEKIAYIDKLKGDCFRLKSVNFNTVETDELLFKTIEKNGELNEIAIYEEGKTTPIKDFEVLEYPSEDVKKLFNEQDKMPYDDLYKNSTYFDEIYHARTAYEHIHGIKQYENTHPPLGKLFIALGIKLFGMTPFGWRIVGTVFGAFMIPAMYLFGLKIFQKKIYAISCAFLMMFDFMHFTQTRIATIDVYVTFFIILMYYWMYDVYVNNSKDNPKVYYRSFMLAGIMFGIGVACKWIAVYASMGLFIILLLSKYKDYKPFKKINSSKLEYIKGDLIKTIIYGVIFFITIPIIIYSVSYIPVLKGEPKNLKLMDIVIGYMKHMFNYHSKLKSTHPFSSMWYEWPIIKKPMWYYVKYMGDLKSTISSFGNPLIWWMSIPAFFATIIISIKKKDKRMISIVIAALCQYIPWMLVKRTTYIYHFFSILPFGIIMIIYVFENIINRNKAFKKVLISYLGLVFTMFVIYYPVLSGMIVSKNYIDKLRLFKSWIF